MITLFKLLVGMLHILQTEYIIQFSERSFQKTNRHGDGLIT